MSTPRNGRRGEKVGLILNGLSAGVLLLILGLGVLTIVLPAVVGGMPLSVLTGSMRPHLPPGTLVVTKPVPVEEIAVGDVITFQIESGQSAVVTHRVIERSIDSASGEVRFTTQGDANNTPDPEPVRPVQVRGKVWYAIPYLGWVNQAVDGQTRSWAIPALAGGLFLYALWTIGSGIRDRVTSRRRSALEPTVGDSAANRDGLTDGDGQTDGGRPADGDSPESGEDPGDRKVPENFESSDSSEQPGNTRHPENDGGGLTAR